MKYKIVLPLIASLLFTTCNNVEGTPLPNQKPKETFIWDSNSKLFLSQKEYDDVILPYVKSKYPQKVEAYRMQQQQQKKEREKLIRSNTLVLGGLMWQDNSDTKRVKRNWQGAKDYCKNLFLLGYSDWRLGNENELSGLYKYESKLKHFSSDRYWSSTMVVSSTRSARIVDFTYGYGYVGISYWSSTHYVRCVRNVQ